MKENKCSNCKFRDENGYCTSGKMWEEGIAPDNRDDCVVYDYYEGGKFWVGPDFGCVHFHAKDKPLALVRCPGCNGKKGFKMVLGYKTEWWRCKMCYGTGLVESISIKARSKKRE